MEDLISQYRSGRKDLRDLSRRLKERAMMADDTALQMEINADRSLVESMIRDMTEAISLMKSPFNQLRGSSNVVLIDPHLMSMMEYKEEECWDPTAEDDLRSKVMDQYQDLIKERLHLLTNKQRSTLKRWIFDEKPFSLIAQEDAVTRQAIFQRIFGNKTHSGALRKLKDGR